MSKKINLEKIKNSNYILVLIDIPSSFCITLTGKKSKSNRCRGKYRFFLYPKKDYEKAIKIYKENEFFIDGFNDKKDIYNLLEKKFKIKNIEESIIDMSE